MNSTDVQQPEVVNNEVAISDAEKKRIESTQDAIRALQKATDTVFKYCLNENFRQMTMEVLQEQDWTRVSGAVHSRLTHLTKTLHNVDIAKREDLTGGQGAAAPVAGIPGDQIAPEADVVEEPATKEMEDDDFDQLAVYAELMETEP